MAQNLQSKINQLRQLFNTINTSTPEAVSAINQLNNAFNLLLTSQRLTLTSNQFKSLFMDIVKGSDISVKQIDRLSKTIRQAWIDMSKLSVIGTPQQPANMLSFARMRGREIGDIRYDLGSSIVGRYADYFPNFPRVQELRNLPTNLQNYVGSEFVRSFMGVDPARGISPFFDLISRSPQDLLRVSDIISDLSKDFATNSAQAQRAADSVRVFQDAMRASAGYINSFKQNLMPLNEYLNKVFGYGRRRDTSIKGFLESYIGSEEADKVFKNLEKRVKEYGMQLSDLRSVQREASTGIIRMQFVGETKLTSGITGADVTALNSLNLALSKSGQILNDTQRRFRSFFSGISRDIGEAVKWAIAISAVYTPLRKFGELVQEMIQNQAKLAEVQIITGRSSEEVYKSFGKISFIASRTGESVLSTIDSYKMAYIAAGNIRDENVRAATATKLLSDTLTLSRLSALGAEESMDILSATLKQMGMSLDEGSILLDKWVAVSKQANVDLQTLATSFSIIASAAENVGLDVDEINGIIAATSEVSTLSARETGNMIRAFLSGYQTESAVKELNKFGIATRDAEGNLVGFMQVFTQIKELSKAGLISESQMARIAEILGGGARRGAQLSAFISNMDRIQQIAEVSRFARTGEAMEALNIRMETVDATANTLRVSFSRLAQTLGHEGGILNFIILLNKALTTLTDSLTLTTKALGDITPLLAFGGAVGLLFNANKNAGFGFQKGLGTIGYEIGNIIGRVLFGLGITKNVQPTLPGISRLTNETFVPRMSEKFPQLAGQIKLEEGITAAMLTGASAAGDNMGSKFATFLQKNYRWVIPSALVFTSVVKSSLEEDFLKAGVSAAGALVGALASKSQYLVSKFGTAVGPIGMIIGFSMANAFLNAARNKADFTTAMAERLTLQAPQISTPEFKNDLEELIKQREDLQRRLESSAARNVSILGGLVSFPFGKEENNAILRGVFNLSNTIRYTFYDLFHDIQGITYDQFSLESALQAADQNLVREYKNISEKIFNFEKAVQEGVLTKRTATVQKTVELYKKEADAFIEEQKRKLYEGVNQEIPPSQFREKSTELQGINLKTAQFFVTVGEDFAKLIDKSDDLAGAYRALMEVLFSMSTQESTALTGYVGMIDKLAEESGPASEKVKQLREELAYLLTILYKNQQLSQFKMPTVISGQYTPEEAELITKRARELTREFYEQLVPDKLLVPDFLSKLTPIAVQVAAESGSSASKVFWKSFTEIDSGMFDRAKKELEELGLIKPKDINIQPYTDITKSDFQNRILPLIKQFERIIGESFYGGAENVPREPLGLIFKDGTDKIVVNLLALRLAMDKANELLQKQLDGIFNLPEGAELWVPAQAAELALETMRGMQQGTGTELLIPDNMDLVESNLDSLASSAYQASTALQALSTDIIYQEMEKRMSREGREWLQKQFQEPTVIPPRNLRGVAAVRETDRLLIEDPDEALRKARNRILREQFMRNQLPIKGNETTIDTWAVVREAIANLVPAIASLAKIVDFISTNRDKPIIPPFQPRSDITPRSSLFIPTTNTQPVSKVDLTVNTTNQVVLDGRIIALALKRYLARDLRVAAGGRSVSNNFFV